MHLALDPFDLFTAEFWVFVGQFGIMMCSVGRNERNSYPTNLC